MKKALIFLIVILTSCAQKKSNDNNNEIIEVKNAGIKEKVKLDNESYYKFNPENISNVKVDSFSITESYQIKEDKFIFGSFNLMNSNVSKDNNGIRFLVLNNKGDIKYKFKSAEDLYLYKPYFYKNKRNNKIIIVCHLAYEYFFGGDVYLFQNEKTEYLGKIDIEGKYEENTLIDILKINESKDKISFTFDVDSITFKPGNEDKYMKNSNIRYEYFNRKFKLIK